MGDRRVFQALSERLSTTLGGMGLAEPTPPQAEAMPAILQGQHVLLIAPTGTGKTEAALLPILDGLLRLGPRREGISVLYITPLRALNRDMQRRLERWGDLLDFRVDVRHGDTTVRDRRRQALKPPDLLVTTPETLQAILPGKVMRRHLSHVRWVVVDEVHELAEDRRGVQLAIALERLEDLAPRFQRIGLSATVGNPREVAAFLAGRGRPVTVVDVSLEKAFTYTVELPTPVPDDYEVARNLYVSPEAAAALNRIEEWLDNHRSALIFVNSRGVAEVLASRLNMLRQDVGVHHGSLPREERARAENRFKAGELKALVCTSTLELGIDIGSVDLVLQYMSPRQVSGLIQRVGRSGHALGRTSRGVIIATSVDDTLEAVAVALRAQRGLLEPLKIHRGALDVLGHQVMGIALDAGGRIREAMAQAEVSRAEPYADLPGEALRRVVDFFVELRLMRREDGQLIATGRGRDYYYQNLSMIRDERRYPAIDLTTQHAVGILGDEFMMLRARQGVNFLVKGKAWKIERIGGDGSVYVTPVENPLAILPGWDGEMLPVPFDLALEVAGLRRAVDEALDHGSPEAVTEDLGRRWPGNPWAVRRVVDEIAAHRAAGAPVPTERRLLVEAFGRYLIVHAPFGEVVNEALGDLIEDNLAKDHLVRFWWADAQRILVELTVDSSDLDLSSLVKRVLYLSQAEVEAGLKELLQEHMPLGFYMKFIAERFGALPRGKWWSADEVNSFPLRFKGSPVEDEALREVNLLHLDPPSVREALRRIREGEMEVLVHRSLERPTPLGYPILRRFIEAPELFAPDANSDANLERMKNSLEVEMVSVLCLDCGAVRRDEEIRALGERPECPHCHSRLLGLLPFAHAHLVSAYERKRRREKLQEDEAKAVARVRQSADLVLSYGKRAVVAQAVYGIGPQTAAKILARMHDDEKEFYRDLLEAKLRFITTRSYWDR